MTARSAHGRGLGRRMLRAVALALLLGFAGLIGQPRLDAAAVDEAAYRLVMPGIVRDASSTDPIPPPGPTNVQAHVVAWDPDTCTITVQVSWWDNATKEAGYIVGPPSTPSIYPIFPGYARVSANTTSVQFTYTYGGGLFPVFVWSIAEQGGATVFSEGPLQGLFLDPQPPGDCL